MKLEDLLEKKEAKKIALLKSLMLVGGKASISDLMVCLDLSKKSVENYLEELQDELTSYQKQCQLTLVKGKVHFEMATDFSLATLEHSWYMKSPKYLILIHLLENKELAFIRLTQELAMSESSLSRKIKEINQILKEFDLMVWQGKLEGEESQIRYFYFQLLWYLNQYSTNLSSREEQLIQQFQRALNLEFGVDSKQRITLWVSIMKRRIAVAKPIYKNFYQLFVPYMRDPLYQRLKLILQRLFSYYAVEIKDEEIMLHFIFLTGMSVLSEKDFHQYSLERSRFTPSSMTDTLILEKILKLYPRPKVKREQEASCYYHLSQIHLRLYFFKGDLEVYNREHLWQLEEKLSSRDIRSCTQQLIVLAQEELQLVPNKSNSLLAMTELKYLSLLAILDVDINREIKVGIDLKLDPLFREAAVNMYKLYLKSVNGVVVEGWKKNHEYDLVITNREVSGKHYYRLSELGTAYDINQIKRIIREL